MTVKDFILCSLEAELKLSRTLGERTVEVDMSAFRRPAEARNFRHLPEPDRSATSSAVAASAVKHPGPRAKVVFLHHAPLSSLAAEIVRKIAIALKIEPTTAVDGPLPDARVYVVLGSEANRKFFPDERTGPGNYLPRHPNVYVTYSPELFVRLGVDAPEVQSRKREMWKGLKGVMQRHEI